MSLSTDADSISKGKENICLYENVNIYHSFTLTVPHAVTAYFSHFG